MTSAVRRRQYYHAPYQITILSPQKNRVEASLRVGFYPMQRSGSKCYSLKYPNDK